MKAWREMIAAANDWMLHDHVRSVTEADARRADEPMRMTRGQLLALLWYAAALLVSYAWLGQLTSVVARAVVALLPLPPMVLIVALSVRSVLGLDELQRRIELVALAVVAVSSGLGCFTAGMLQRVGVPLPSLSLVFSGMVVLYLIARRWAGRHYA